MQFLFFVVIILQAAEKLDSANKICSGVFSFEFEVLNKVHCQRAENNLFSSDNLETKYPCKNIQYES